MKFVFDNIIFELQRVGGISVYWAELISRMPSNVEKHYFGCKSSNILSARFENMVLRSERYSGLFPRRYLQFSPANKVHVGGKHIFHSSYIRYSNCAGAINVTTAHDFTYERFVSGPRLWVHAWQKKKAVKKSKGIICVSENTKKDLLHFYPWLKSSSIKVIYNGVGDDFFVVENPVERLREYLGSWPDNPYLLFVGDRSDYKNFDSFVGLAKYFPDMSLVVVGGKPFSKNELEKMRGFDDQFSHFRGISSEVLNYFYNAAHCLVYPSSYEGFGIPVLEAMKAGCPVVATNASSIPEVAGDAALLVNEPTPENLAAEIRRLQDSAFRSEIIEKGFVQAAKFSWDKCFEETYAFYRELWDKE